MFDLLEEREIRENKEKMRAIEESENMVNGTNTDKSEKTNLFGSTNGETKPLISNQKAENIGGPPKKKPILMTTQSDEEDDESSESI